MNIIDTGRISGMAGHAIMVACALAWTLGLAGCEGDSGGGGGGGSIGPDNDANKISCMGDSITAAGYPAVLGQLTGKQAINGGRGGDTTYDGVGAVSRAVSRDQSGYVCILYGANDVIRSYDLDVSAANLSAMVQSVKAARAIPVLGTLTPMIGDHAGWNPRVIEFNKKIRSVASSAGARLVDLYGPFDGHPEYYADGLHPNSQGNQVLAQAFDARID